MKNQNSRICPICYLAYNNNANLPRIIPCDNGHSMCSSCVKEVLARSDKGFKCPFDNKFIYFTSKVLTAFPINRALIDLLEDLEISDVCKLHAKTKVDLACLTCKDKICYLCEKEKHRGHKVELIRDIWKEVDEKKSKIKGWVEEIEKMQNEEETMLINKENQLIQDTEENFDAYITELQDKRETLKDKIRIHFEELRGQKVYPKETIQSELFKLKNHVKIKLKELESKDHKKQGEILPYDIFEQEDLFNSLKIDDWIFNKKEEIEELKSDIDKICIRPNDRFLKGFKETAVDFYPLSIKNQISEISSTEKQVNQKLQKNTKPSNIYHYLLIFFTKFHHIMFLFLK